MSRPAVMVSAFCWCLLVEGALYGYARVAFWLAERAG